MKSIKFLLVAVFYSICSEVSENKSEIMALSDQTEGKIKF